MGCSLSCATFEKFSTFLDWLVNSKVDRKLLCHYVDDFFTTGRAGCNQCQLVLDTLLQVCLHLNVPIAEEKTEGPSTTMCFVGLEIDSVEQLVRIPKSKVEEIVGKNQYLLCRKKAILKEIQSLIGSLNFACRAIRPGRPFMRRLINATIGVDKPNFHIRLNKGMKADLEMWLQFCRDFNGVSLFLNRLWATNDDIELFTDSSAAVGNGFGIFFQGRWAWSAWPNAWHASRFTKNITFLEFFPVLVSLELWGSELKNRKLIFRCDNSGVVQIVNSLTSRCDNIMVLLRRFTLTCLRYNILVKAVFVSGSKNLIADSLSRLQFHRFRQLAPAAEKEPTPVPTKIWELMARQ